MSVVVVVQGDTELLQIVLALCSASCLASLLNSRQQQCNQDRDDRDHNQQLDQGEPQLQRIWEIMQNMRSSLAAERSSQWFRS